MTLILTLFSRNSILQVSDRLVSDTHGATVNAFANKSVVFQARDGRAVLCYSGAAYVAGFPTDLWMAYRLLGREIPRSIGLDTRGQGDALSDLADALSRLADDFNDALRRGAFPRAYAPVVSVGAWQALESGRSKRRMWATVQPEEQGRYEFRDRFPRQDDRRYGITATPAGWATAADIGGAQDRLGQAKTLDDCELVLTELIRRKADSSNGRIGKDCMSVLMNDVTRKVVRTRYLPSAASSSSGRGAYAPAFAWPGVVVPPSLIWGVNSFGVADVTVEVGVRHI